MMYSILVYWILFSFSLISFIGTFYIGDFFNGIIFFINTLTFSILLLSEYMDPKRFWDKRGSPTNRMEKEK